MRKVQVLASSHGIAKGTEEVQQKVKAELKLSTPELEKAKKALEDNTVATVIVK